MFVFYIYFKNNFKNNIIKIYKIKFINTFI